MTKLLVAIAYTVAGFGLYVGLAYLEHPAGQWAYLPWRTR